MAQYNGLAKKWCLYFIEMVKAKGPLTLANNRQNNENWPSWKESASPVDNENE